MKYKTGLVLSGGGSRGMAHLGVIKALNEKGIFPDVISGSSAGAIMGSLIADGHSPDEILTQQTGKKFLSYTNFNFFRKGLLNFKNLRKMLKDIYTVENIEDLKIPFYACASNLNEGKAEYFNSGNLTDIVTASSSVPFIFKPVEINGKTYTDGGLIDNLPIKPLLGKCEKIICVNLIHLKYKENFKNSKQVYGRTFDVLTYHNQKTYISECDILIEPPALYGQPYFNNKKAHEIFNIGYDYVMKSDIL
ncbi:MAG: patatin-like phospholipase family protein [Bacteroidales bacterium]|nr:patatin-like phospholipase family protein [Bacteroidales bacterium]